MRRSLFYTMTVTWGLPMSVFGAVVALLLCLAGYRPTHYHGAWLCTVGRHWGGLSLGPVLLTAEDASDQLRRHELGHAIQNIRYGPAILPLILISVIRYHLRNDRARRGLPLPPYDSWWFEAEATRLGTAAVSRDRSGEEPL